MSGRSRVALLVCALGLGCVFTSRPQLPGNDDARNSDAATGTLAGNDAAAYDAGPAYDTAPPPTADADASADAALRDASPCDLDAADAGDADDAADGDAGDAAPLLRCDAERDGTAASAGGR